MAREREGYAASSTSSMSLSTLMEMSPLHKSTGVVWRRTVQSLRIAMSAFAFVFELVPCLQPLRAQCGAESACDTLHRTGLRWLLCVMVCCERADRTATAGKAVTC